MKWADGRTAFLSPRWGLVDGTVLDQDFDRYPGLELLAVCRDLDRAGVLTPEPDYPVSAPPGSDRWCWARDTAADRRELANRSGHLVVPRRPIQ